MTEESNLYYSDTVHIGNRKNSTAVVCLWTKKERLIEKLDEKNYCLIGQLYSREYGLLILLRNLLANPKITDLVVTGIDLNDSATGLINFFNKGVDDKLKIKGTDIFLDKKITKEYVDTLRKRVTLHDLRKQTDFSKLNNYISELEQKDVNEKPIIIELPELDKPIRYPADNSGFKIRGRDFSHAYEELLFSILRFGKYDPEKKEVYAKNILFYVTELSQKDLKYLEELPDTDKQNKSETHTIFFENLDCWEEIRTKMKGVSKSTKANICIMIGYGYLPENKLEDAVEAVEKKPRSSAWDPDPRGNLVIRVENGKIKVLQIDQKGKTVDSFEGTDAKSIYKKVASEKRISMLYHALDIGAELQKAETALKKGKKYVQDRPQD